MLIGESFVGTGVNSAHVNTILGEREGPVGAAWATALSTPRAGHASFVVTARPGVAACPPTLFVNKATVTGVDHANLTWGPAQAGVAGGVALAVEDGTISRDEVGRLVLIAAVWVNPSADDAEAVYTNNIAATHQALRAAKAGKPDLAEFEEAARAPFNAFFRPSGAEPPRSATV
ncbi:MAG: formaldehyde-activating enzyme [Acidimicrobiales bacterium]